MDEYDCGSIIFLTMIIVWVGMLGVLIFQNREQINTRDSICKSLELGNYLNGNSDDKTIDNEKYLKCTKEIYNSTTKEIITSEKWVRLP